MNIDNIKPYFESIETSEKYVANQGFTYNESGKTYNEVGMQYGGLYGNEGNHPCITISDYKP